MDELSLDLFVGMIVNISIAAAYRNIVVVNSEAKVALEYLAKLHQAGKVDDKDFNSITEKLKNIVGFGFSAQLS